MFFDSNVFLEMLCQKFESSSFLFASPVLPKVRIFLAHAFFIICPSKALIFLIPHLAFPVSPKGQIFLNTTFRTISFYRQCLFFLSVFFGSSAFQQYCFQLAVFLLALLFDRNVHMEYFFATYVFLFYYVLPAVVFESVLFARRVFNSKVFASIGFASNDFNVHIITSQRFSCHHGAILRPSGPLPRQCD